MSSSNSTFSSPGRLEKRVESIQWLRGIAAMLVVFNHAALLALENAPNAGGAFRLQWFNLAWLGGIGVDVFFVISGFVMALGAERHHGPVGAAHFMLQRYNRIAPLFYLLSAVLLADMIRADVHFETKEVINTLIFIPLFDWTNYSWPVHYLGWTLAFEFVFYFIVASMIATGQGSSRQALLAILIATPLVAQMAPGTWLPWRMLGSPMMWEFGLGVAIYLGWRADAFRRHRHLWRVLAAAAVIAAVAPALTDSAIVELASSGHWTPAGAAIRFVAWGVPSALLVAGFFTLRANAFGALTPALQTLGDISYSLYLTHLFVVRLTLEFIQRFSLHPLLAMLFVLGVAPIVAWLTYRWLERPLLAKGQHTIRALVSRPRIRAVH